MRYSINYDYICGKGNKPCWRCGKITNEKYYCGECKSGFVEYFIKYKEVTTPLNLKGELKRL